MPDPLLPGPLWLAGCGNMAGAMLARWLEQGVDPAHVSVIRPSGQEAGEGVRVTTVRRCTAAGGHSSSSRWRISFAALLVNVTAQMR